MNSTDIAGDDFIVTIDLDDPNESFAEYWSRIFVADHIKQKLVNYSELERRVASRLDRMTFHRHGVVLLAGPPGTGKTSLAKGAANEIATRRDTPTLYQRIRIQKLFSSGFGDTPELVDEAFNEIIEIAQYGDVYQVVLIDEVESLFSNRTMLAGDTDPMDAVRAVNRALERLDDLAEYPNVFVIATSNQPDIVDSAFADRTDAQLYIGMPDDEQRTAIFVDVFSRLNETFGTELPTAQADLNRLVRLSEGFSGRRIRKILYSALASSEETTTDPSQLAYGQVCKEFDRKRTDRFDDGRRIDTKTGDVNEAEDDIVRPPVAEDTSRAAKSRSLEDTSDHGHGESHSRVPLGDSVDRERDRKRHEHEGKHTGSGDPSRSDGAPTSPKGPNDLAPMESGDRTDQGVDHRDDGDTPNTQGADGDRIDDEAGDAVSNLGTKQNDEDNPPDDPSDRSTIRFARRVMFDPTVRAPHLALRDDVRAFLNETLATAGYDGDGVDGVLDTAEAEEFLYELCMGRRLDQIRVTIDNVVVDIDVIRDHTGRSNLRVPTAEAIPTIPSDATIKFTFVHTDDGAAVDVTFPDVPGADIEFVSASSA